MFYTPCSDSATRKPSIYTGGMYVNERELKEPFARVCLAFECGGWSSKDLVPLCVMQLLLGGGSSFSAGNEIFLILTLLECIICVSGGFVILCSSLCLVTIV